MSSETVAREVARGAVDLGIAGEIPTAEPLARRQIALDELVGIAPPRLFNADCVSLGELAQNRLLLGPEGSSTRTVSERCLARADYRPAQLWELDSYESIKRAVKDRLGVSFTSRLLVSEEIEREELLPFRVSGVGQMRRPIHVLQYSAKEPTPEGSVFMSLLAEEASAADAEWQPTAVDADRAVSTC